MSVSQTNIQVISKVLDGYIKDGKQSDALDLMRNMLASNRTLLSKDFTSQDEIKNILGGRK